MFNGIAIPHSLAASARDSGRHADDSERAITAFVKVGNFRLDIADSKVAFDAEALKLHGAGTGRSEFGIGEWVSLYHPEDRASVLKLIGRATMMLRGFRFQARALGAGEPRPMIECYARLEGTSFRGIFLSSLSHYAELE